MHSTTVTRTDRLFFALWPDTNIAQHLYQSTAHWQLPQAGRRIAPEQLHLTLVFIGAIEVTRLTCVRQVAENLHTPSFEMHFDTPGLFPKAQVVWLGMQQIPPALQQLQTQLVTALQQQCELPVEDRAYVPHLTLWRKVKRANLPQNIAPIYWPVSRFVLAASQTTTQGARYRILHEWPLQPN